MVQPSPNGGTITAAGFAHLLARLHPDPERGAQEYERLRRALMKFFDWRGAWPPDECADIALDRLARKLEEATTIADVRNYAHGIAKLVLLERRRQPAFSTLEEAEAPVAVVAPPSEGGTEEAMRTCFDRCLDEISEDGRSLVLRYYEGRGQLRIASRRRLAASLGVSENALRSRVQRLRDRLEQCVHGCVAEAR